MTPQNIMERLLEFARAAGQRAMNYQYKLQAQTNYLKNCAEVRTVVTKADLEISRQFRSFVESQFAELNPLIVDEESVSALGHKPFEKINNAEYVFIIDPIDGTLTYANQMALYGISVGVYQNGKPLVGFLYAPALNLLVCADDKDAYQVAFPFTDRQIKTKLMPPGDAPCASPVFFISPKIVTMNDKWPDSQLVAMGFYSSVVHYAYIATLNARAAMFNFCLWDIAGAYVIFDRLGIEVRSLTNGTLYAPFDTLLYDAQLKVKDTYLVSHPKDYDLFKDILVLRGI